MPAHHYPLPDYSTRRGTYYVPQPRKPERPAAAPPPPQTPPPPPGPAELHRAASDPYLEALLVDTIEAAKRGPVTVHVADDYERDRLNLQLELAVARKRLTDTQYAAVTIQVPPKPVFHAQPEVAEATDAAETDTGTHEPTFEDLGSD